MEDMRNSLKFLILRPFLAETGKTSRSIPESANFAMSRGIFSFGIMSIFVYATAIGSPNSLYFLMREKSSSRTPSWPSRTYKIKSTAFALSSVVRIIMSVRAFFAL